MEIGFRDNSKCIEGKSCSKNARGKIVLKILQPRNGQSFVDRGSRRESEVIESATCARCTHTQSSEKRKIPTAI